MIECVYNYIQHVLSLNVNRIKFQATQTDSFASSVIFAMCEEASTPCQRCSHNAKNVKLRSFTVCGKKKKTGRKQDKFHALLLYGPEVLVKDGQDLGVGKVVGLVQLSDLDAHVGAHVQVHVVAAVQKVGQAVVC